MKFVKNFAVLPLCGFVALAALLPAGCGGKSYEVYTNIPDGTYSIVDGNFKKVTAIGGYIAPDRQFEETDTSAYTVEKLTCYAMTTYADCTVCADFSTDEAKAVYNSFKTQVKESLLEIEKSLSASVIGSDIYNFNGAEAGATLEIGKIAYEVLSEAKYVYNFTEGYYNPALFYNIQAYGFGGALDYPQSAQDLPDDGVIAQYTALASHFGDLNLFESEGKYYVTKPDFTVEVNGERLALKLDLGGIGKGYAVDCIDALYDEYGYKFGAFNFGASSMLAKSYAQKGAYDIGFSNPRSLSREPYLVTTMRNETLSTSGDNEKYYLIDGKRYCHIISPVTGKPVQTGIMSVTVIGGSAAQADALTTAIMTMEKDGAISFIQQKLTDRKVAFTFG